MSPRHERAHDEGGAGERHAQRLDKWLWFARITKTRTLAAELIDGGKVRINGVRIEKSSATVKIGDTVAVLLRERMRLVVVRGFAERRGSAQVAAELIEDKTPPKERLDQAAAAPEYGARDRGSGRPTKKDRRAIARLKGEAP